MRKAQQLALAGRPFAELMNKVLVSVRHRADVAYHPLLQVREVKKELVVVISTDKGLCGGLNTNLLRETSQFDSAKARFVTAGRKAVQYIVRTKRELLADFPLKDSPAFIETKAISKFCIEKFESFEVDKVSVLYTHFVNTLVQKPLIRTLLPLSPFETLKKEEAEPAGPLTDYQYEPDAETVLHAILPYYVHYEIYQMILDARASEHSARMVAMKSATDNAKQLIKDLTLEYNKLRQASITTELLEISTAQMALG